MEKTAVYRTQDASENFKIRVELRKLNHSKVSSRRQRGDSLELPPLGEGEETTEEYTFTWQEKVFSKGEAEFYQNKTNCVNYLDKKYHELVVDPSYEVEKKTKRLFTLVHTDILNDYRKLEENVTSAAKEAPSFLVQSILKNRKSGKLKFPCSAKPDEQNSSVILPSRKPGDHFLDESSSRFMYIMADIQPEDSFPVAPEEVTLCSIELSGNGFLRISPDFNNFWKEPYTLHNSRMDTFEYMISHSSIPMMNEEVQSENRVISSILKENKSSLEKRVGHVFEMPQPDILKAFIFGEIASARGFGESNLHVCFSIHLPKGWTCEDPSWLSGITQKCRPKEEEGALQEETYFSFPFEGELCFPYQKESTHAEGVVLKCPLLFVEVWSTNYWDCLKTEGYGYANIPATPGCHTLDILTWRPVAMSIRSQLERFFIGGVADIDDLTFVSIPQISQNKQVSKLGFCSEASGTVKVRLNIAHQAESFLQVGDFSKKQNLLDKLELSVSENSLDTIMAAFNRARQRMLAARSNLIL